MSHYAIAKITLDSKTRAVKVQVDEWESESARAEGFEPKASREFYVLAPSQGGISLEGIDAAFKTINWSAFPPGDQIYLDGQGVAHSFASRPGDFCVWSFESMGWISTMTEDAQWVLVRTERDKLLKASDWVSIRAADTGVPMPLAWAQYRQALRDIGSQADPFRIVWPLEPQ